MYNMVINSSFGKAIVVQHCYIYLCLKNYLKDLLVIMFWKNITWTLSNSHAFHFVLFNFFLFSCNLKEIFKMKIKEKSTWKMTLESCNKESRKLTIDKIDLFVLVIFS